MINQAGYNRLHVNPMIRMSFILKQEKKRISGMWFKFQY